MIVDVNEVSIPANPKIDVEEFPGLYKIHELQRVWPLVGLRAKYFGLEDLVRADFAAEHPECAEFDQLQSLLREKLFAKLETLEIAVDLVVLVEEEVGLVLLLDEVGELHLVRVEHAVLLQLPLRDLYLLLLLVGQLLLLEFLLLLEPDFRLLLLLLLLGFRFQRVDTLDKFALYRSLVQHFHNILDKNLVLFYVRVLLRLELCSQIVGVRDVFD